MPVDSNLAYFLSAKPALIHWIDGKTQPIRQQGRLAQAWIVSQPAWIAGASAVQAIQKQIDHLREQVGLKTPKSANATSLTRKVMIGAGLLCGATLAAHLLGVTSLLSTEAVIRNTAMSKKFAFLAVGVAAVGMGVFLLARSRSRSVKTQPNPQPQLNRTPTEPVDSTPVEASSSPKSSPHNSSADPLDLDPPQPLDSKQVVTVSPSETSKPLIDFKCLGPVYGVIFKFLGSSDTLQYLRTCKKITMPWKELCPSDEQIKLLTAELETTTHKGQSLVNLTRAFFEQRMKEENLDLEAQAAIWKQLYYRFHAKEDPQAKKKPPKEEGCISFQPMFRGRAVPWVRGEPWVLRSSATCVKFLQGGRIAIGLESLLTGINVWNTNGTTLSATVISFDDNTDGHLRVVDCVGLEGGHIVLGFVCGLIYLFNSRGKNVGNMRLPGGRWLRTINVLSNGRLKVIATDNSTYPWQPVGGVAVKLQARSDQIDTFVIQGKKRKNGGESLVLPVPVVTGHIITYLTPIETERLRECNTTFLSFKFDWKSMCPREVSMEQNRNPERETNVSMKSEDFEKEIVASRLDNKASEVAWRGLCLAWERRDMPWFDYPTRTNVSFRCNGTIAVEYQTGGVTILDTQGRQKDFLSSF